jgi:hypothetical protein
VSKAAEARVAVLIGSGVSCAAGLPGIQSLSEEVAASVSDRQMAVLEIIRRLTSQTHGEGRDSYEDWYFIADQVCQHIDRNFENPALLPMLGTLGVSSAAGEDQLANTSRALCDAITRIVCARLSNSTAEPTLAFNALDEAIKKRGSRFAFFSLNHDLLLERFLRSRKLAFYDGFETHPETPDFRTFNFSRVAFEKAHLSVTKLHGSVNWRRYRPMRNRAARDKWRDEFFGIILKENRAFEQMDDSPLVLIGTFNKILQYSTPVFLQMLGEFHHYLQTSSRLIVCGYGFGDKGINTLLAYWMSEKTPHTMYLIDPSPFDENRCRGAIAQKVGLWQAENRLKVLPKKIGPQSLTWAEVFEFAGILS